MKDKIWVRQEIWIICPCCAEVFSTEAKVVAHYNKWHLDTGEKRKNKNHFVFSKPRQAWT